MTGPYRNHVERRSSREPARQFVSETHDHKPDAPGSPLPDFFTGTSFAVDEVEMALRILTRKVRALTTAHAGKEVVGMKLAAEDVAKVSNQINLLAKTLVDTSVRYVNRKPRA